MSSCSGFCREEFRLKNFLPYHENPQTFVQFQCGHQTAYLAWRVVWLVYHVVWIIMTGVRAEDWAGPDPNQQVKWFIYLTDLAYLLVTLSAIMDFCAVAVVFATRKDIRKGLATELPWYVQMAWVMTSMGNVIGISMSLLYWTLVHSDELPVDAINVGTHILNSVYILLNQSFSGMPIRILHFWYPALFAVAYSLFTLFYYLAGGTNASDKPYIYSVIDWREPGMSVVYVLIVVLVLVPIVHVILYGIHVLKIVMGTRCGCCEDTDGFDVSDGTQMNMEATKY